MHNLKQILIAMEVRCYISRKTIHKANNLKDRKRSVEGASIDPNNQQIRMHAYFPISNGYKSVFSASFSTKHDRNHQGTVKQKDITNIYIQQYVPCAKLPRIFMSIRIRNDRWRRSNLKQKRPENFSRGKIHSLVANT